MERAFAYCMNMHAYVCGFEKSARRQNVSKLNEKSRDVITESRDNAYITRFVD